MLTAFASFLADSGGEEQDDGFLGRRRTLVSTYRKISGCLIALTAKAVFVETENCYRP